MCLGLLREDLAYKQEPCQSHWLGGLRLLLTLISLAFALSACRLTQEQRLKAQEVVKSETSLRTQRKLDLSRLEEKDLIIEELSLLYDSLGLSSLRLHRQETRGRTKTLNLLSEDLQSHSKEERKLQVEERRGSMIKESFALRQSLSLVLGLVIGLLILKILRK